MGDLVIHLPIKLTAKEIIKIVKPFGLVKRSVYMYICFQIRKDKVDHCF